VNPGPAGGRREKEKRARRDELISRCLPRAGRIADWLAGRSSGVDEEELRAVAYEALVLEADKFDPARFGGNPELHMLWLVKLRVIDWLRRQGPVGGMRAEEKEYLRSSATLDAPRAEGGTETHADHLEAEGPAVDPAAHLDLEVAMNDLPPRERAMLRELYLRDRTARDVAEEVGISEHRVWQIRKRALKRLASRLTGRH
jgi:RNA polymerase sigma factor (sigma-70 family)